MSLNPYRVVARSNNSSMNFWKKERRSLLENHAVTKITNFCSHVLACSSDHKETMYRNNYCGFIFWNICLTKKILGESEHALGTKKWITNAFWRPFGADHLPWSCTYERTIAQSCMWICIPWGSGSNFRSMNIKLGARSRHAKISFLYTFFNTTTSTHTYALSLALLYREYIFLFLNFVKQSAYTSPFPITPVYIHFLCWHSFDEDSPQPYPWTVCSRIKCPIKISYALLRRPRPGVRLGRVPSPRFFPPEKIHAVRKPRIRYIACSWMNTSN